MKRSAQSLHGRLTALFLGTTLGVAGIYVVVNVLLVFFVPILHDFTLSVVVVDDETQSPVSGAVIRWSDGREAGVTNKTGACSFTRVIQDNPWWIWPKVGRFRPQGGVLLVEADAFAANEISLNDVVAGVPYSDPRASVVVRLRCK